MIIIILIIIIIIDLYILIKSNIKLYMIFSAFMLPIIIVLFYYNYYPSYIIKYNTIFNNIIICGYNIK